MSFFRSKIQPNKASTRWFAGLCVTSCCRRLEAALVGIHGVGTGSPIEFGHGLAVDLPQNVREAFADEKLAAYTNIGKNKESGKGVPATGKDARSPLDSILLGENVTTPRLTKDGRSTLLEIQEETIRELLATTGIAPEELLAIGVYDPGIWSVSDFLTTRNVDKGKDAHPFKTEVGTRSALSYYENLCDVAGLATRTGHNIFDAFPAKDLAAEGHGGPIFALPYWVLLHSPTRHRLLLDLGQEARITFLPELEHGNKKMISYGSAGSCGCLIDPIVRRLTNGEQNHDDGGRLAVQGEQLPELREFFATIDQDHLSKVENHCSPFVPMIAARQIAMVLEQAKLKNWSLRDVLSTAVSVVACRIARLMRLQFGSMVADAELFVTGDGARHGALINQIQHELACGKLTPIEQLNVDRHTFDAASIAVLTSLTVDQIPGNLPHLTGATTDQILGRLTPGSPQNWQRLLQVMATAKPAVRPLRSIL